MKTLVRSFKTVWLTVFLAVVAGGALRAQTPPASPTELPNHEYDQIFAAAKKMETDEVFDQAFQEYTRIKNENENSKPEIAADALLRATLLGFNAVELDHSKGTEKLSAEQQDIRNNKDTDLAKKAHDALKQLHDNPRLESTAVGRYVMEPHWKHMETGAPADLKTALESRIDHRNSRQINYQFIDKLVHMTGAIPQFSYWFALIIIAVVVKTITFPLMLRTYKSQREMQKIQPEMKALQEKYKGKPELNEKMMELYKKHNVNPFASCVPMLVQLPFMIYVYNTIRLYEYHFSHGTFLWIGSPISFHYSTWLATDLSKFDIPLLTVYALSNYLTMKLNPSPDPAQAQQQKQMSIMMTVLFFWMFMKYQWSAAFIFYWLILNLITSFQQYNYIFKPNKIKAQIEAGGASAAVAPTASPAAIEAAGTQSGGAQRPRPKARKRK